MTFLAQTLAHVPAQTLAHDNRKLEIYIQNLTRRQEAPQAEAQTLNHGLGEHGLTQKRWTFKATCLDLLQHPSQPKKSQVI